ncbi:MAG TPA: UDP-3-O-(3-hydroxymyristoyl)glucosamine N-acyltransferase [Alphaproteobacteria bacterium]|nr:UDP-3-O-(3-hydroxymyristoyl)glucosamine N-acyltransferase [Alphaproteobacteria bacterium]
MADTKFHPKNGRFKLGYLAEISGCTLLNEGYSDIFIDDTAPLEAASSGKIAFLQNPKYIEAFKTTSASAVVISEKHIDIAPEGVALLISKDPYFSYTLILKKFYHRENQTMEISEFAHVDLSVEVGKRTKIGFGTYIGANCVIGNDCTIHSNVNITNAIIGNNVIIHSGVSIGQDGFGYAYNNGRHHKVPQVGRVIIGDDVEIGANTTIDRGSAPDTIIGEGTKIDNLVQIGHNVKIGKHCIIVSQVGISGSTEIGDYTIIAGQAGIAGHLKIGSQVQVAAQAGITRDLEDKAIVGGTPAVPLRQYHKQALALAKLTEKNN